MSLPYELFDLFSRFHHDDPITYSIPADQYLRNTATFFDWQNQLMCADRMQNKVPTLHYVTTISYKYITSAQPSRLTNNHAQSILPVQCQRY
jgi:hypothetical protein